MSTFTVQRSEAFPQETVMTAVPGFRATTRPLASTLATEGLLLDHVSWGGVAVDVVTDAVRARLSPVAREADVLLMATLESAVVRHGLFSLGSVGSQPLSMAGVISLTALAGFPRGPGVVLSS